MGGQSQSQQGSQVYYDPEVGQYYTQAPRQNFDNGLSAPLTNGLAGATQANNGMVGLFNLLTQSTGNGRTYLNDMNNMNNYSPNLNTIQSTVNVPTLDQMFSGNQSVTSLLGETPSGAIGQAPSGAGRFM
jgi:hypothetical protein